MGSKKLPETKKSHKLNPAPYNQEGKLKISAFILMAAYKPRGGGFTFRVKVDPWSIFRLGYLKDILSKVAVSF